MEENGDIRPSYLLYLSRGKRSDTSGIPLYLLVGLFYSFVVGVRFTDFSAGIFCDFEQPIAALFPFRGIKKIGNQVGRAGKQNRKRLFPCDFSQVAGSNNSLLGVIVYLAKF